MNNHIKNMAERQKVPFDQLENLSALMNECGGTLNATIIAVFNYGVIQGKRLERKKERQKRGLSNEQ